MRQCSNPDAGRSSWIDAAKGIGIILVVLGHTYGTPQWLHAWIYSFHMPLFFILSGMTLRIPKDVPLLNTAKKYAKAYLLPYAVLCLVNLVLEIGWQLLFGEITLAKIGKYVLGCIYCCANMTWMPNCSPLWFLPCLFISKTVYIALSQRLSEKGRLCAILALAALAYLWYRLELPRLPWNMMPAMMSLFFLWIGQTMTRYQFPEKCTPGRALSLTAVMLLLFVPIIRNGSRVGMNENTYGNLLLFLVGACGFSALTILLARRLSHIRVLHTFWGRNTIVVIGFNYFVRTFSTEFYYWIPYVRNYQIHWISSFALTMLMLAVMIYCWGIINKVFSDRKGNKNE